MSETVTAVSVAGQAVSRRDVQTPVTTGEITVGVVAWNKIIAAAYLRHRIAQEIGENPAHGAVARLARDAGVLPQTVSQLRKESRAGTSVETFDAFASLWKRTHDEFFREAREWAESQPDVMAAASREPGVERVERPERYSNFELAAEVERRSGTSEEAIDHARVAMKGSDLTIDEWREEIRAAARRLRLGAPIAGRPLPVESPRQVDRAALVEEAKRRQREDADQPRRAMQPSTEPPTEGAAKKPRK
jgi:transcriptional regulator with XRE-family HTH domain